MAATLRMQPHRSGHLRETIEGGDLLFFEEMVDFGASVTACQAAWRGALVRKQHTGKIQAAQAKTQEFGSRGFLAGVPRASPRRKRRPRPTLPKLPGELAGSSGGKLRGQGNGGAKERRAAIRRIRQAHESLPNVSSSSAAHSAPAGGGGGASPSVLTSDGFLLPCPLLCF